MRVGVRHTRFFLVVVTVPIGCGGFWGLEGQVAVSLKLFWETWLQKKSVCDTEKLVGGLRPTCLKSSYSRLTSWLRPLSGGLARDNTDHLGHHLLV